MHILSKLFSTGGATAQLTASEYKSRFVDSNTPHLLVDVRSPAEFADGHLAGARNIPLQEIEQRLRELPKEKEIVLYCRSGNRSGMALRMLQSAGYQNVYNAGSLNELARQGLQVN
ncbi:MAG: rhodanese-like domain-containing protein [Caldilineaceae bacterium]